MKAKEFFKKIKPYLKQITHNGHYVLEICNLNEHVTNIRIVDDRVFVTTSSDSHDDAGNLVTDTLVFPSDAEVGFIENDAEIVEVLYDTWRFALKYVVTTYLNLEQELKLK